MTQIDGFLPPINRNPGFSHATETVPIEIIDSETESSPTPVLVNLSSKNSILL